MPKIVKEPPLKCVKEYSMKVIDCYYIKGYGKESKCKKIHGVGIAYNVGKSLLYCKAIVVASSTLAISPIVCMIGLGVGQGFVSAAKSSIGM